MTLRVLFDATRLTWRARRNSPTGIDRVMMAYAAWLERNDDIELTPVALAGDRLTTVPPQKFSALLEQARSRLSTTEAWQALLQALQAPHAAGAALRRPILATPPEDWLPLGADILSRAFRASWAPPPRGDIYLNVAHTGLHRRGLLQGLTARGVAPVVMVHDLIPITHPEYCTPGAAERHAARIAAVLDHTALVIANSQATADDLKRHAAATGKTAPPVEVAWLGVEEAFVRPAASPLRGLPYFVSVGTIEARKNLAFLLGLWRRLAEAMGPGAPHLVLVGRRGWENEAVIDHLERSPAVRSLVHEVADLEDDQLAGLIAGSRALLAPSLAEGFDLPSVEALCLGASVIASDIPVHREVARGARLIDPFDGPGWLSAIMEACNAPRGPSSFVPPSWAEHFRIVDAGLKRLGGVP